MHRFISGAATLAAPVLAWAGPFSDPGIPADSSAILGWATAVTELTRGPVDIADPPGPLATFGGAADALGPATGGAGVVSLGDGGRVTLSFATPITNGPGADFAVFENGFFAGTGLFAELAFVEVSSDGTNFVRFPSRSQTPTTTQLGSFDVLDPTNIAGLAGKHPAGEGTPFDLQVLADAPLLNVSSVTQVRLVDVVGRISNAPGYLPATDSVGVVINDPYPTPFASGGFDLDGVAVLNIPEPTAATCMLAVAGVLIRPGRRDKPRCRS